MKVEIVFGILMILILLISGCDVGWKTYNPQSTSQCKDICLNEGLQFQQAITGKEDSIYCYCEKVIQINTT